MDAYLDSGEDTLFMEIEKRLLLLISEGEEGEEDLFALDTKSEYCNYHRNRSSAVKKPASGTGVFIPRPASGNAPSVIRPSSDRRRRSRGRVAKANGK